MSKENLKNKGITLIALIITIIVMLILTGVTLSITLGDNGLVNKAKEAATQTQIAMDRELLLSAAIGTMGNDGKVNLSEFVLPEGFTGSNGTYTSANGHTFTVSGDGEVFYTGDGIQIGAVDLNGRYYMDSTEWYIDILNHDTWIEGNEEDSYRAILDMTINESTKSGTMTVNYIIDENTMETEPYTYDFTYELVMENDAIINKIINLINEEEGVASVLWQNTNGFEYNLDGDYFNESGTLKLTFSSANGTVDQQMKNGDNWSYYSDGQGLLYFSYKDIYSMNGEIATVSEDLNTIVFEGITYTRQFN